MALGGTHALFGELDDDAERLARMEERLYPGRVRVVAADDGVAAGLGALAGLVEARDLEGHVMDARAACGEEAVDEAVGAAGLEDLEVAAAFEAPDAPVEDR